MVVLFLSLIGCDSGTELQWNKADGYQWAELPNSFWGKSGFKKISSSKTGIEFSNKLIGDDIIENRNLANGSGVAAGDINGDGYVDLYFTSIKGPNKLYVNTGNMKFEDVTEDAGVAHSGFHSTGAVFADVNGNGNLDLIVSTLDMGNALYVNNGEGKFKIDRNSGIEPGNGSTSMTLADINGDGFLDLYVSRYKEKDVRDIYGYGEIVLENIGQVENGVYSLIPPFNKDFSLFMNNGRPDVRQNGVVDQFYINQGDGTFKKKEDTKTIFFSHEGVALGLEPDWGLTAKFQDLNNDMLPDIYVSNDYWTPDRVWINQGDGTFKSINPTSIRKYSYSSMSVDFSDINRNGHNDIITTEMLGPIHERRIRQNVNMSPLDQKKTEIHHQTLSTQNSLQMNRGDNTYAEIAYYSGLEATDWTWATQFMDVNLNGYEDLIVTTGHITDSQDLDVQESISQKFYRGEEIDESIVLEFPELRVRNQILKNNGDLTFTKMGREWGFTEEDISHGMAIADLNNDGSLDVVINRLNNKASVYQNMTNSPRIAVRLKGHASNTQGIGAKIELLGGPVWQQKEVSSGGGYLSGSDPLVVFAANKDNDKHLIKVTWPDGHHSIVEDVRSNRIYEIEEADIESRYESTEHSNLEGSVLFQDVSSLIDHIHQEEEFDDFAIQPLLPKKMSNLGPGISWIDIDQNGFDDLLIPSGKGGNLEIFRNFGNKLFENWKINEITKKAKGDQTAIIGWNQQDQTLLTVGSANYEKENFLNPSAYHYSVTNNNVIEKDQIQGVHSTTGPIAAADYDGNGYVDLFIGGRFVPLRYPENASSRFFRNQDGAFIFDKINSNLLEEVGLVTGAVFSDFNDNGWQDLLISTEWGPLKLFRNQSGVFREVTEDVGLSKFKGIWNGVATGDFNNDGRIDIVATNWGLNSIYQLDSEHPLKMFYGDFVFENNVQIIESYFDEKVNNYVPRRQLHELDKEISLITQFIDSHEKYASMSLYEVLNAGLDEFPELEHIKQHEINTLEHIVFLNTGDGFKAYPLPRKAQFSSAFHVGVSDFDNDGYEDLFLSQNFFGTPHGVPRQDSGRGIILKGDGSGKFIVIPGHKSGIKVYGEQRGAAFSDFDQDGKVDIAISQNNSETKLYLNKGGKKGVRIKLEGPESNKDAIGSSVRLIYENGNKGPRREIQAGSGYWSQNSTTQILGFNNQPKSIEVIWFNGTKEVYNIINYNQDTIISFKESE